VKDVVLPGMEESFDGGEALCVSFECTPKVPAVYCSDRVIELNDEDEIVADFDETIKAEIPLKRDNQTGQIKVYLCG
jgi:hypothetical protein